ncbi:O-antigen ligase domain-containing protein [Acinetobacter baumannii]|uniref:O-antigen ligase domain-containing protein n=1 Tax=Acinetobacter baumannii TaxID=470 RepID=UPI000AC2F4D5|nr:O-antigen ligase domain-containing protein [Acinetobacter baumannii]
MTYSYSKKNLIIGFSFFSSIFFFKYILVKPAYVLIGLIVFLGYFYRKNVLNISYFLISYFLISYLILSLYFFQSDIGMVLNAFLSILVYPIFLYATKNNNIKSILYFLNFSILYLALESIYRLLNPVFQINDMVLTAEDGSGWFYPYKINSFMFTDSNFVALHIYCLIVVGIIYNLKLQTFLLCFLMLLTFSRSGIIGSLLFFLMFTFSNNNFFRKIKYFLFVTVFVLSLLFLINTGLINDGSFLSKFYIYDLSFNYMVENFGLVDYIFGVGLANSFINIGIGAHSIGVILLFETGILGTFLYFLYFLNICIKYDYPVIDNRNVLYYFLFVFFIMGFSLGLYIFPIMVLTIALIQNRRNS